MDRNNKLCAYMLQTIKRITPESSSLKEIWYLFWIL